MIGPVGSRLDQGSSLQAHVLVVDDGLCGQAVRVVPRVMLSHRSRGLRLRPMLVRGGEVADGG